jgi:hypothetical protein
VKRNYSAINRKAAATRARMKRARQTGKEPTMPDKNPLFEKDDEALIAFLLDAGEAQARNVLLKDKVKQLIQLWHIVAPDVNAIIATPWTDDEGKEMAQHLVREKLTELKAKAYCLTLEGWVSRYDEGEFDPNMKTLPKVMPSGRINRVEIVSIFASTRAMKKMRMLSIVRNPDTQKIIDLKVMKLGADDGGQVGGSMASLFDEAAS